MGSKSRIAKHIVPILQNAIDESGYNYYEPFCGGCNIIDKIKAKKRYASDNNKYLIALWKYLINNPNNNYPEEIPYELYSDVRSYKENYEDWYVGYVGFLASYNGRFFDGGYAKTIISKTGNVRNYYDEAKRNIMKQIKDLTDVKFAITDYRDAHPRNLVIYVDPPYANTKQYSTSKNFDYNEFWQIMCEWSKNNIVFISEENAPDDFEVVWQQEVTRTQDNRKREIAVEKLFKWRGEINANPKNNSNSN